MHDSFVLIPAHNEQATIAAVVRAVRALGGVRAVVVDDCSTDATRAEALGAGALVLPLRVRIGAFGAIQAGIRYALAHGARAVATIDADGQHPPRALPALLGLVRSGQADVAIGSCPQRGSRCRRLAWRLFRRLSGFSLDDLTSGLRAYTRPALEVLLRPEAYNLDYQDVGVLLLLRDNGLRIREIPVAMCPREAGSSRIFGNWFQVMRYMLDTTLLCMAKAFKPAHRNTR